MGWLSAIIWRSNYIMWRSNYEPASMLLMEFLLGRSFVLRYLMVSSIVIWAIIGIISGITRSETVPLIAVPGAVGGMAIGLLVGAIIGAALGLRAERRARE
jgi:membrane associated rhomboid family serine protease